MLEAIKKCKNCGLCKNQMPLLDKCRQCDVMWVGLSAKMVNDIENETPLDKSTNTGRLIADIESELNSVTYYKTNIVKCVPLDEKGKLRYPNKKEMGKCIINLHLEIQSLRPRAVFLLGNKAKEAVEKSFKVHFEKKKELFNYQALTVDNIYFFAIEHPSYIFIYKRKKINEYKNAVVKSIENIF